jgi:uncharacterized membrane-anchored protein YitT (DUF2179 family)
MTKYTLGWEPSSVIFVLSVLLLIISFIFLGKEKTRGSILGSILFPLMVKLTAPIIAMSNFEIHDTVILLVVGAVVAGTGSGILFRSGFTAGGTDIINQILHKYLHVSISKAMLMCDGLIVLSSGFFMGTTIGVFAWEKVIYGIIVLFIYGQMADKVILGISDSKCFYIFTNHETAVKKFIMNYLNHGVTVLDGRGGYTGDHKKIIMCIVPTKEYYILKEGIHTIDPNAFFVATDAYEVKGGE